jgi:hypothetical protein
MLEIIRRRSRDFVSDWAVPICMGLATGVAVWLVWYFTKPQCTATAAANAVCNLGVIAHFINVEILLKSGGAALAVGTLKGGYDRYIMRNMLNQERETLNREREALKWEREARHLAEQQLADERRRADEAQTALTEMFNELRDEIRQQAERRQREEEERREERRLFVATQQALLDTITRMNARSNGRSDNGG